MKHLLILSVISTCIIIYPQEHELWWEECLDTKVSIDTFAEWLGDTRTPSRIKVVRHIHKMNYRSVLDIPCGLCVDYDVIQELCSHIRYYGIDITPKLVKKGKSKGLTVQQGSIEAIPMQSNSVDVTYSRHILEHLDYYEKALQELVRVARQEAIVVFFIKPNHQPDTISRGVFNDAVLYHNRYNRKKLENFLATLPQVAKIEWEYINEEDRFKTGWVEIILHIYLQ